MFLDIKLSHMMYRLAESHSFHSKTLAFHFTGQREDVSMSLQLMTFPSIMSGSEDMLIYSTLSSLTFLKLTET